MVTDRGKSWRALYLIGAKQINPGVDLLRLVIASFPFHFRVSFSSNDLRGPRQWQTVTVPTKSYESEKSSVKSPDRAIGRFHERRDYATAASQPLDYPDFCKRIWPIGACKMFLLVSLDLSQ